MTDYKGTEGNLLGDCFINDCNSGYAGLYICQNSSHLSSFKWVYLIVLNSISINNIYLYMALPYAGYCSRC